MINIRYPRGIQAVLRSGSLPTAVRSLYVSQPVLSQAIRKIKASPGLQLFDRSIVPIALVCTGQKYLGSLEKVTALSVDLVNEIREIRNEGKD